MAMYISRFEVGNYKAFWQPATLRLERGINIVTGKNNAGKTALLEALSLGFQGKPHRSSATIRRKGALPENPTSWVDLTAEVTGEELRETLLVPNTSFRVPLPPFGSDIAGDFHLPDGRPHSIENLLKCLLNRDTHTFRARREAGERAQWVPPIFPTFGLYEAQGPPGNRLYASIMVNHQRITSFSGQGRWPEHDEFGMTHIIPGLPSRVYHFRAERFNAGSCDFGNSSNLKPNSENLAEVLGNLQHNHARFGDFCNELRHVLPEVKWVSVRPHPVAQNRVEIVVWTHDPASRREDLAVPLNESGTGIGQVLAILYVVMTSDQPTVIVIDEPQSFLHRGATRKLIEILRGYSQHQFIIASHSPTVIGAANPRTITLVRHSDGVSSLESVDVGKTLNQRLLLEQLGGSLADLFGADSILWVEGPTEEDCLPKIIEHICRRPLRGTVIRGVRAVGDFEGKHAELAVEIYNRLSGSPNLIPPLLGFIFDDEGRTCQEKQDLIKRSKGRIHFIARRMFENYVLNPKAIAAVANEIEGFRPEPLTEVEVRRWLDHAESNPKYGRPPINAPEASWLVYACAGAVLRDLFNDLSETRVSYDKRRHSVALTEWLIEHSPEDLKELATLINSVLDETREPPE